MFNQEKRLIVDLKVQNRLREWFSRVADPSRGCEKISCIEFGDSDVNYELSFDYKKIRVLNAPFNSEGIKNKLAYTGFTNGVNGVIKTYLRHVNNNGEVSSYYNYPSNNNLTLGITPPTLENGLDVTEINFNQGIKEGYIIFNETLPINFLNEFNTQLRLNEKYSITLNNPLNNIPPLVIDNDNGSFFIFNNELNFPPNTIIGNIVIKGISSGISKTINIKII